MEGIDEGFVVIKQGDHVTINERFEFDDSKTGSKEFSIVSGNSYLSLRVLMRKERNRIRFIINNLVKSSTSSTIAHNWRGSIRGRRDSSRANLIPEKPD